MLIGAVLGGLLTLASGLVIETRRENRQIAREALAEERQLRRALRLVYDELEEAMGTIEVAVNRYLWWPFPSRRFEMRRWDEFAPVLAGSDELTQQQWLTLTWAYEGLRELEGELDAIHRSGSPLPGFGVEEDRKLRALWELVNEGRGEIAELVGRRVIENSFDEVAAMIHAAEAAARSLMPAAPLAQGRPARSPRSQFVVKKPLAMTGVALVRAPNRHQFEVEVPAETILSMFRAEITGSDAVAMSPRKVGSDLDTAKRFVPDSLRRDIYFEGFTFLVAEADLRRFLEELSATDPRRWSIRESMDSSSRPAQAG